MNMPFHFKINPEHMECYEPNMDDPKSEEITIHKFIPYRGREHGKFNDSIFCILLAINFLK